MLEQLRGGLVKSVVPTPPRDQPMGLEGPTSPTRQETLSALLSYFISGIRSLPPASFSPLRLPKGCDLGGLVLPFWVLRNHCGTLGPPWETTGAHVGVWNRIFIGFGTPDSERFFGTEAYFVFALTLFPGHLLF